MERLNNDQNPSMVFLWIVPTTYCTALCFTCPCGVTIRRLCGAYRTWPALPLGRAAPRPEERGVHLARIGAPPRLERRHGGGEKPAEGLPNDVGFVGARPDLALHQGERLLVRVQIACFVLRLDALRAVNRRFRPDIGQAMRMVPLGPHPLPLRGARRVDPVQGKIRPGRRRAVPLAIGGHALDRVRRREIPQMAFRQVFPRRGVRHPASFVRKVNGQAASEPFGPHPILEIERRAVDAGKRGAAGVAHGDLRHDGDAAYGLAVAVAGDVRDALVPDAAFFVVPAVKGENGMDGGPADLTVPEPQRRIGSGMLRPGGDVRCVPLAKLIGRDGLARILSQSVGAVRDYAGRLFPFSIKLQSVATVERRESDADLAALFERFGGTHFAVIFDSRTGA